MDLEDVERRKSALGTILAQMNVPEQRKTLTAANLRWLNRNLGINNAKHPMYSTARALLTELLKARMRAENKWL